MLVAQLSFITQVQHELLHYLVALPFEVFTPSSVTIGIEAWTWVVRENPRVEVALMLEFNAAWAGTIRHHRGIFSTSMKYVTKITRNITY